MWSVWSSVGGIIHASSFVHLLDSGFCACSVTIWTSLGALICAHNSRVRCMQACKKKKTQNYGCLRQALIIGISLYSFISSSSGGDIFGMLSCRLCALMHSKQVTCSGFADGFMEEHWWCFWRDKLRWSVIILFWVHVFLAICLSPAGQRSGQVACPRATDTNLCCHFQNFNSIGDLSAGILMVILNCCYINMTFKLCF